MADILIHRFSEIANAKPTIEQIELGEIQINTKDGKIYFAKSGTTKTVEEVIVTNATNQGNVNLSGNFTATNFIGPLSGTSEYSKNSDKLDGYDSTDFATVSGNTFNGNQYINGSVTVNDGMYLEPNLSGITQNEGGIIHISNDDGNFYFTKIRNGVVDKINLKWLEGNLYTGLLSGGVISAVSGQTTFNISAGSGIIVTLNASLTNDFDNSVKYVTWGNLTNISLTYLTTKIQTYIAINENGQVVQTDTPFYNLQYNNLITLGTVLHQNKTFINSSITYPNVAYGYKQRTYDFIKAFGGLKLSGYKIITSGTLGLNIGSGTAWLDGRNYQVNPNNPSFITDSGTTVSKIFRYYQISGDTFNRDTNNGLGYTSVDPTNYNNNGVLTTVPGTGSNRRWTVQRIFWYPNSASKSIVVYYGNQIYSTSTDAIANNQYEEFYEDENTKQNAIFLGSLILRNDATFTDSSTYFILPAGIFRNVGGSSGGGGDIVSTRLQDLTDVVITTLQNGDLLFYDSTIEKWKHGKTLPSNYTFSGVTNNDVYISNNGLSRDKYRLDTNTSIGLQSGVTYGSIENDYAMTFQMTDGNNKGFWWGSNLYTTSQGAMALSNDGRLTVSNSARIGYGINDTTLGGQTFTLDVNGSGKISSLLINTSVDDGAKLQVGSGGGSGGFGLSQTPSVILGLNNNSTAGSIKLWGTTSGAYSTIQTTTGNLHLDSHSGITNGVYLNFYNSSGFVDILNGKARFSSNGFLGIGTTSPSAIIDVIAPVTGTTNGIRVTRSGTTSQYIQMDLNDGSSHEIYSTGASKALHIVNNSSLAALGTFSDGISFFVPTSTANTTVRALTITSGAIPNIGLLTNAPTHSLTLSSTTTGYAHYNTSDQTTNYERLRMYWSGNNYFLGLEAAGTGGGRTITIGSRSFNNFISIKNSIATDETVFDFGSNITWTQVGVRPIYRFSSILGGTGPISHLLLSPTINQTSTGGYTTLLVSPYEQAVGTGSKLLLDLGTNTLSGGTGTHTSKFSVDNGGNLTTIGNITFSTNNTGIYSTHGSVVFGGSATNINGNANGINFYLNNVIQHKMFATGNVGIGTTTDAGFKLDVNGTSRFSGLITANGISSSDFIYANVTKILPSGNTFSGSNWNFTGSASGYGLINRDTISFNEDGFTVNGAIGWDRRLFLNRSSATGGSGVWSTANFMIINNGTTVQNGTVITATFSGTGNFNNVSIYGTYTGPQSNTNTYTTFTIFDGGFSPKNITNAYGLKISNELSGSTITRGVDLDISSGTGKFNIYASGTANNFFGGSIGIGTTSPTHTLTLASTTTGYAHYNTSDQTTNYERARMYWNSNTFTIANEILGTGTARSLSIVTNNRNFTINPNTVAGVGVFDLNHGSPGGGGINASFVAFRGGNSFSSGTVNELSIISSMNQTGTASYRGLWMSIYEQSVGSGTKQLIDLGTNTLADGLGTHTSRFSVDNIGNTYIAGNTLIGTTTDSGFKLDVNGTSRFSGNLKVENSTINTGDLTNFTLEGKALAFNTSNWVLGVKGGAYDIGTFTGIKILNGGSSEYFKWAGIAAVSETAASNSTGLSFWTQQAEKMRLTTAGFLGIGTTSPTHTLTLSSTNTGIVSYNTSDQTTNFERLRMYWSSNIFNIATENGGTGTGREINLTSNGALLTIRGNGASVGNGFITVSRATSGNIEQFSVRGTYTNNSNIASASSIVSTFNQSGTAGYRALWISPYEQALGSGQEYLIDAGVNSASFGSGTHTSRFSVDNLGNIINSGTINTNGILTITDTTDSNSLTTGSIKTSGGVAITKSLYIGQGLAINGGYEGSGSVFSRGILINSLNQTTSSTTAIEGMYINTNTLLGTYTTSNVRILNLNGITKGTSHTITNAIGLQLSSNINVGTNNTNILIGTSTAPSGNYSIYNSSTYQNYFGGNVGIGITSPTSLLHLKSNTDLFKLENTDNTKYTQQYFIGDGRTFTIGVGNSLETTLNLANKFYLYDLTSNNVSFVVNNIGYLGLGTTTPNKKLEILDNNVTIRLNNNTNFWDIVNNSSNNITFLYNGVSNYLTLTNNGYLGINNSSPNYSIDTNGSIRLNGNLIGWNNTDIKYLFTNDSSNSYINSGNFGIGTTTPTTLLDVNGITRFRDNIELILNSYIGFNTYYTNSIGWRYRTNGYGGSIYMNNNGDYYFTNSVSGATDSTTTFNVRLVLSNSGNLLVGTTTDLGFKINVNGGINTSGYSRLSTDNGTVIIGSNNIQTQDTTLRIGYLRGSSGNSYLDLVGDVTYQDYGLRIIRSGGANGNSSIIHRGTGNLNIETTEGGKISFLPNGTEKASILNNGNTLIGTSVDDGAKLQVGGGGGSGGFNLSQTPSVILGLNNNTNAGSIKLWGTTSGAYSLIQTTSANLHLDSASGNNGIYLNNYNSSGFVDILGGKARFTTSGNLGIGTTSPNNYIDVIVPFIVGSALSSSNGVRVTRSGNTNQYIQIDIGDAANHKLFSNGAGKGLYIVNNSSNSATNSASDGISFYVPSSVANTPVNAMQIISGDSPKIGIGTIGPNAIIDIYAPITGTTNGVRVTRSSVTTQYIQMDIGNGSSHQIFSNGTSKGLSITNNSLSVALGTNADGINFYVPSNTANSVVNAIAITSGNLPNIGFGTTAPTHTLTLASTTTGYAHYNTSDQTTNYERVRGYWSGNVYNIGFENGGTGSNRNIKFNSTATTLELGYNSTLQSAFAISRNGSHGNLVTLSGSLNNNSGVQQNFLSIIGQVAQGGTNGYRALWISPYESSTGSGNKLLIDAGTNSLADGGGTHTSRFWVNNVGNIYIAGNTLIGTTTDAGFKLDVNGTSRFNGAMTANGITSSDFINSNISKILPSGSTFSGSNWYFTGSANGYGLINRDTINFNEDGFSVNGATGWDKRLFLNRSSATGGSGVWSTANYMIINNGTTVQNGTVITATFSGTGNFNSASVYGTYSGPQSNTNTFTTYTIFDGTFSPKNVTNAYGLRISNELSGSTLTRGVDLDISSGSGKFNVYASGTANNYFGGSIGIGTTSPTHTLTLASTSTGFSYYNTSDQTTNYERLRMYWSSNIFTIATENGGTGTGREINLISNGALLAIRGNGASVGNGFVAVSRATSGNIEQFSVRGTYTNNSNIASASSIVTTINQTGTAGYRALWVSPYEQTVGSGSKLLLDLGTNSASFGSGTHTSRFSVDNLGNTYINGLVKTTKGVISSDNTRVITPNNAFYNNVSGTISGSFKIKLPTSKFNSSTMLRMTIKIYSYEIGKSYTIECGGYNFSDGVWRNVFANIISDSGVTLNVRFGRDTTSNCIWIGELTTNWTFPQVYVTEVQLGYGSYDENWLDSWSITPVTSFDTVNEIYTASYQLNSKNQVYAYNLNQNLRTTDNVTFGAITSLGDYATTQYIASSTGLTSYRWTLNNNSTFNLQYSNNNFTSNTNALTVFNNGNMGIGLTGDIGYKLAINGYTSIISGGLDLLNNISLTYYSTINSNYTLFRRQVTGEGDGNGLSVYSYNGTTTNLSMVFKDSGNVSIGTLIDNGAKLNVNGIISSSSYYIGSYPIIDKASSYSVLYDFTSTGNSHISLYLGDINDPSNYYDNGAHNFRDRSGNNIVRISPKGLTLYNRTTTQISSITSPENGALIYDSTLNNVKYYNGSSWKIVSTTEIGSTLKTTILSNSDVTITTSTATTTSFSTFASTSYTPTSSSSYLIIECFYNYTISGTGSDTFKANIEVDSVEISSTQMTALDGSGTDRTNKLTPIIGRFTNSSTTAKTINIRMRRVSGDDSVTINNDNSFWLKITEIVR